MPADELVIPDWVPAPVASVALRLFETSHAADRVIVQRLATDPRMERVWKTLTENWRGQRPPVNWPASAQERVRRSARVFEIATQTQVAALRPHEVEKFQSDLRELADRLEDSQRFLGLLRRGGISIAVTSQEWCALRSIITKCRAAAEQAEQLPRITRARSFADRRQRGFLTSLAQAMQLHFGTTHYATVATMASVALNRSISAETVRRASAAAKERQSS